MTPERALLDKGALDAAERVVAALADATTGVIGEHPEGFEPCAYDATEVRSLTGAKVERVELEDLFAVAEAEDAETVHAARTMVAHSLGPLDALDQESLDRSLRLYCGLRDLAGAKGWSAFATRCWPECFTEFGGAACAPQAMLTGEGVPGGCEADVYGSLTSLVLLRLAGEAPFVADLVQVDLDDDTGVFWHCGLAPLHMADPRTRPHPAVHSNRAMPLLHEFALRPGRATIARLSRAGGVHKLVVGSGEVLAEPLAFSGTAGVLRFDGPAERVLDTIVEEGLDHHYGLVYGTFVEELRAIALLWGIPVVELT